MVPVNQLWASPQQSHWKQNSRSFAGTYTTNAQSLRALQHLLGEIVVSRCFLKNIYVWLENISVISFPAVSPQPEREGGIEKEGLSLKLRSLRF